MKIEDLTIGDGAIAEPGKTLDVHYTGTLTNGEVFDSSVPRGKPFTFRLGSGQVIQGWEQGLSGMKVGGKRRLTVPPLLGYGQRDMGKIPANSTLIFEIELLKVR
ncbi:FKBP-type peptidyl-prolyl cis-trans isomerase [Tuwongella immobilis]